MKNILFVTLFSLFIFEGFSQYNPRPTRSRFYNSRLSTFTVKPGDILIYDVVKDSQQYDLIVTVKNYGNDIKFDYEMPAAATTGNISIFPSAVSNAIKYDTVFNVKKSELKDEGVLWLSRKNFRDIAAARETNMDLGNGSQHFTRNRTSTMKINYKGKQKIVTVYNVQSTNGEAMSQMLVLNDERNPLIVSLDSGWKLTLKEVR